MRPRLLTAIALLLDRASLKVRRRNPGSYGRKNAAPSPAASARASRASSPSTARAFGTASTSTSAAPSPPPSSAGPRITSSSASPPQSPASSSSSPARSTSSPVPSPGPSRARPGRASNSPASPSSTARASWSAKPPAQPTPPQLAGATICTQTGTTTERNLSDWFTARKLAFTPVVFETADQAVAAYEAQRCDAYTTDRSTLAARLNQMRDPAANVILPDTITTAANGPVVRRDDPQWAAIVRWTLNALISAEAHGITAANADQVGQAIPRPRNPPPPRRRRRRSANSCASTTPGHQPPSALWATTARCMPATSTARSASSSPAKAPPRCRDGGLLYSPSFE